MLGFAFLWSLPTIWIVDANNGPGTHFTDLPAAVAAAQTGDTLLVRAGVYTAFTVTGKALTIRGAGPAATQIALPTGDPTDSHLTIRSTPPGTAFFLSGIDVRATWAGPSSGAVNLLAGARAVLANCRASGANPTASGGAGRAGLYANNAEVHASRCEVSGGVASWVFGQAGASIDTGALCSADACTFTGGDAIGAGWPAGGGAGLVVSAASATIARCMCLGGSGWILHTSFGGNGAAAVNNATLRVAGTLTNRCVGGPGNNLYNGGRGLTASNGGSIEVHGPVTVLAGGVIAATSGAVTLGLPALPYLAITSGSATTRATFDLDGLLPGAPYLLLAADAPGFTAAGPWVLGTVLLSSPSFWSRFGLLDASGRLQFTFPLTAVPALLDFPLHTQAAVFDVATSQLRLTQGSTQLFSL